MISVTPGSDFSLRAPPLADYNFTMTLAEMPVVIEGESTATVEENGMELSRFTDATTRTDAKVSVSETGPPQVIRIESGDESRATVDDKGDVITTGEGEVAIFARTRFLDRRITHNARTEGGQSVDTFIGHLNNTLGKALYDTVDALVASGGSVDVFSQLDHAGGNYTRNAQAWTAPVDWSGVAVWNQGVNNQRRAGTLISRRHIVCANHYSIPLNRTVRFVTPGNEVITRTTVAQESVDPPNMCVISLNADVPESIAVYPVPPANLLEYLPPFNASDRRAPVINHGQFSTARLAEWHFGSSVNFREPEDAVRAAYWDWPIYLDSGQPCFMVLPGNAPVLLGLIFHFGSAGSIASNADVYTAIQAAMDALAPGYTLQTVDLSAYPTFNE